MNPSQFNAYYFDKNLRKSFLTAQFLNFYPL